MNIKYLSFHKILGMVGTNDRSAHPEVICEEGVLKNLQENICVGASEKQVFSTAHRNSGTVGWNPEVRLKQNSKTVKTSRRESMKINCLNLISVNGAIRKLNKMLIFIKV